MMPRMLFGEAYYNLPKPLHEMVADQVQALFDGQRGVKTAQIARAMNRGSESLLPHLRKAARLGLIAGTRGGAWVPLESAYSGSS